MDDVLDEIDHLVDRLEQQDPEFSAKCAAFALGLIEDESPSTANVAALYLTWALAKDYIGAQIRYKCECGDTGWREGRDGGLIPCVRCRPLVNEKWFAEVADSEREPQ